LTLSILVIVLISVALISVLANLFINRQFEAYITEQESARAANIASDLGGQYDPLTQEWNLDYIHATGMYALYDGFILKVYDDDGESVWDAESHDMALCQEIVQDITTRMAENNARGEFTAHEFDLTQHGQKVGSAAIHYYGPYFYNESDFGFLKALNIILIIIGVVSSILALCVGWIFARRISRPITKTAEIAHQISQGNYDIRFEGRTKTRELNELVSAINDLASALNEQENIRKRLTTDVAHELRTPLMAISSHLEMMLEGIWDASPERLQSCLDEIARLGKLVADLEQLAKVEADLLTLNKESVDLSDVAHSVADKLQLQASGKNLSVTVAGGALAVHADKDRIHQVVTNLLSNAIKYTPDGGEIRIDVKEDPRGGALVVEDNGIGILESEQSLIFERFYRTDKSRTRKTGGAGIGLAIVKSIVSAHGGTIAVESRDPHGSRFTVTLPK
jgi:signal transduction histidine kinase